VPSTVFVHQTVTGGVRGYAFQLYSEKTWNILLFQKKKNHLLPTTPQLIESYTEDDLIPMGDESLNYFSFGVSEFRSDVNC